MARKHSHRVRIPLKLERMYRHIVESYLDRGLSLKTAEARAAATVNKRRAVLSRGKRTCRRKRGREYCRTQRGPKLIGRGGSRRQWYPGKKRGRASYVCLEHDRRFKTKAALKSHYRSH